MIEGKIKNKLTDKKVIIYILTVILSFVTLLVLSRIANNGLVRFEIDSNAKTYVAKVERVGETKTVDGSFNDSGEQQVDTYIFFTAKITQGDEKGKYVDAVQIIEGTSVIDPTRVEKGRKIILMDNVGYEDADSDYVLFEFVRTDALVFLLVLFCILLMVFGRIKGFNTIVSMVLTVLAVFAVFVPSVLSGKNIYVWSILCCAYITVMTLMIVQGINRKSITAGIGCISGVCIAGVLFTLTDIAIRLTGNTTEEMVHLLYLNTSKPIDLKAIIFAAIIIGAVGAIMDVAMSVSSALYEIRENSPQISFGKLFRSGLSIGRDMMGTMANTLVLAYIGSSMSTVVMLFAYEQPLIETLNREMIIVDILQALVGSFGILFTIPLTSLISSALYTGQSIKPKRIPKKAKRENKPITQAEIDFDNSLF